VILPLNDPVLICTDEDTVPDGNNVVTCADEETIPDGILVNVVYCTPYIFAPLPENEADTDVAVTVTAVMPALVVKLPVREYAPFNFLVLFHVAPLYTNISPVD
jgi:hypothetical protein